ncbi:cytosine deaminase [Streptomyces sp. APSN-46.1]|uniref:cytosine deaminase n=1 Tax=Streptomyces sp. APSN-46.1 TaxID=2929049 RepID=UPI001FB1F3E7|nr:cytosine deaminase [Streptomyces sp. APSN-46.1]MCJ1678355.1 cytosine deaminase [Streptomyces sp. APSN-46.1]
MRMIVRGARLLRGEGRTEGRTAGRTGGRFDVEVGEDGRIARVVPFDDQKEPPATGTLIEAHGALLSAPFVEPHIHLDTALTAGEPRPNASGTLWEGIARWSERKRTLTREDVIARATEVLRWQAAQGVLHVRTHCDTTDPSLTALDALLELRDRVRDFMTLQIVAFPQEGIVSFPDGEALLREAVRRGADVVGAIPHFEDTREDGVASLGIALALAEEHGLRVDAHCDEIDDDQSRFVEVLATLALRSGLRERVTASHTTAMGSYGGAYSFKLQRLLARSGINLVSNPFANLNLQGRFDAYPKRRGLTQVKEMLAAGVNVAFGHDDVMDPWNALGTANPLQTALVGLYAAQLTGADEIPEAFSMVTDRAAHVLGLDASEYGIAEGSPASFVLLPAETPTEAIRRQVRPRYVVSRGSVLAETPPAPTWLNWPPEGWGSGPTEVDFSRP